MTFTLTSGVRVSVRQPAPPRVQVAAPVSPRVSVVPVRGPAGPAGSSYAHHQTNAAAEWTIAHNLGTRPTAVILLDTDPTHPVWTDPTYSDSNTLTLTFPAPTTGWVYLN